MTTVPTTTAEQLSEAFAEFENASRGLSAFYHDLESQVVLLTKELSHSRGQQARELAEKERLAARLDNLLQALPGGVVVLDQHGLVQEFNPVADDLLGPLVAGEAWGEVVNRAIAPRWDDGHDVSLTDGRLVNIATQALSGEPGQILLLKDVTETRRLTDQLAHHKRLSAKTETAAAMAHQIRTPLASALLNVGNIRHAINHDSSTHAVDRALGSLRKLERLVDDMLLFARGGQFDVTAVATEDLLASLRQGVADAYQGPHFSVEIAEVPGTGSVYVNIAALMSVSLNLLENAAQACAGKGSIKIESRCQAGALEIRFADNGPGIEAARQALIFEPFHSTRSNGTGLGLAVARAVARAHGGDLLLERGEPGACFLLRLPLIESTTSASATARPHALQVQTLE